MKIVRLLFSILKLRQNEDYGKGEVLLDHMDIADMRLQFKKTSV